MMDASRKLDSHLLHYFLAVVEYGSITRASEALFLAQPSLSRAIRTLEGRVGAALFDRSTQQVQLTAQGIRFVPAARQLLDDLAAARSAVIATCELKSGRLVIATHTAFYADPLVALVRKFRENYGQVQLTLVSAETSGQACACVRRGYSDIAIGYGGRDNQGLKEFDLARSEVVLVGASSVVPSDAARVPRRAVAEIPLILDLRDRSTAEVLSQVIGAGASPRVAVDCSHFSAICGLVSRGVGATLIPRAVAEQHVKGVNVISLDPPLYRNPVLLTRPGQVSSAAHEFIRLAVGSTRVPQRR